MFNFACPACPVALADGTGACPMEFIFLFIPSGLNPFRPGFFTNIL